MDSDDLRQEGYLNLDAYRLDRIDGMIHSQLRALHSYWNEIRAGRSTPMRSDIDPRDMECDARNLFILEDLSHGNVRFRLAGTAIVDSFGMELRGMNARAIMSNESRESFTALIAEVLEDPGTGYARLRNEADEEEVWEINLLPLRSDFGMIDRVIGCLHPVSGTPREARPAGSLRFRIEQMSVEPVIATVPDPLAATPVLPHGFSETDSAFRFGENSGSRDTGPRFQAIEGGLRETEPDRSDRQRPGHLRLIKD